MRTRPISALLVAVLVLFVAWSATPAAHAGVPLPHVAAGPVPLAVSPATFRAGYSQQLTITGTGFEAVSQAWLGSVPLQGVTTISSTLVIAATPWSMRAGTYDLSLRDLAGRAAVLVAAVAVTAGDAGWASYGPYGGQLNDPVIDAQTPSRMFVSAARAGVYRSQDGGAGWQFALVAPFAYRVQIAHPTPGGTPVLYVGGDGSLGIQRSRDVGLTWQQVAPPGTAPVGEVRAYLNPGQPDVLYAAVNSRGNDPLAGLYRSDDQGDNWSRVAPTNGVDVTALAINPGDPDNIVLGTNAGGILWSDDGGVTFQGPVGVAGYIGGLDFAPAQYGGLWYVWASGSDTDDRAHWSTDGGASWSNKRIAAGQTNFGVTFHPTIPGLMWAAAGHGYYSEDAGATWHSLGSGLDEPHGFAVVPGSGSRETTTLLAATSSGLYKSTNGGDNWQESDYGLGANMPGSLAVAPRSADEAYTATNARGILRTFDGGQTWQRLNIPMAYYRMGLATDPFTPGKVYFGGTRAGDGSPVVRVSNDAGATYFEAVLTLPGSYAGQQAQVRAVVPHPFNQNLLLAGVCVTAAADLGPGFIYRSGDGGMTWQQMQTPGGMKCVTEIAIDGARRSIAYAGTNSGLVWSTNWGVSWQSHPAAPAVERVGPIVIHPDYPDVIYLFGGPNFGPGPHNPEAGVFRSKTNGGSWTKMTGVGYPVWDLAFVRVFNQRWLYAATMNGLRFVRSTDLPAETEWEYASGIAGAATVDAFAAGVEPGRVVYYIGTPGGRLVTMAGAEAASVNIAGGVYRKMDLTFEGYVPIVLRMN